MPTYDYECTKCGHVFEVFQSIKAPTKKKPDEPCGGCGERAPIKRLVGTGGAVIFKGSGFYETDYRSESYKKGAEAEKKSTGGDATADGGTKTGGDSSKAAKPAAKSDAGKKSTSSGKKKEK